MGCASASAGRGHAGQAEPPAARRRDKTGVPYDKQLFFDDCNWGRAPSPPAHPPLAAARRRPPLAQAARRGA